MRRIKVMAAVVVGALMLQACALTFWDDHLFLGTTQKPVYQNRKSLGIFLLPLAVAVDALTSPLQVLIMIVAGDDVLLPKTGGVAMQPMALNTAAQRQWNALPPAERQKAQVQLADILAQARPGERIALALQPDGTLMKLSLDRAQLDQLVSRIDPATMRLSPAGSPQVGAQGALAVR